MECVKGMSKIALMALGLLLASSILAKENQLFEVDTVTTKMSEAQVQKLKKIERLTYPCYRQDQAFQHCPDISWVTSCLDQDVAAKQSLSANKTARVPVTIQFAVENKEASNVSSIIRSIKVFFDSSRYPLKLSPDQVWAYRSLFKEFFPKEVFVALKQQNNYIG